MELLDNGNPMGENVIDLYNVFKQARIAAHFSNYHADKYIINYV